MATKASNTLLKKTADKIESVDALIGFKGDIYSYKFPIPDIIADIDAENLYGRIMSSDEPFLDTMAEYIKGKASGEINPSFEFVSNYGNGDVVSGWNTLIAEIDDAGMGAEYIANDSKLLFLLNVLREGLYNNAMVESGVIVQGEDTWNEAMEMGPDVIPENIQDEIEIVRHRFLEYLYKEGNLNIYGVDW